ncbi:MAG: hypothetical protein AVDCRST_MAG19-1234 [uncultured Thermomicrobiales bacterium]|uniref:Uncharacterized protein n=1 Tax=uncultured Thermomicrobiales bacterium TaxID=1645740 RepID=A0A6J4UP79_9BACT|nr:MAG: hypothetical protein AVDCRST_MAG19-1234 [uncultured Thermomicrobiales bacterium]
MDGRRRRPPWGPPVGPVPGQTELRPIEAVGDYGTGINGRVGPSR